MRPATYIGMHQRTRRDGSRYLAGRTMRAFDVPKGSRFELRRTDGSDGAGDYVLVITAPVGDELDRLSKAERERAAAGGAVTATRHDPRDDACEEDRPW